jgi:hypothetical protein
MNTNYEPVNKEVFLPPKMTAMESLSPTYRENPDSVAWILTNGKITRGEEQLSVGYMPTGKDEIVDSVEFAHQKELVESGKQTDVKGLGGWHRNWYAPAMEVISAWKKGGKRGVQELGESGMLTGADFALVKSVLVALKTTTTPVRNHIILDLVTRMNSDRLDLKLFDYQGYDAINEELGVWNIPIGGKGAFTSQSFSQKKYGWHLQWSEDFTMQVYDVDVMQYHVNSLRGQMELVMNKKAIAPINALSGTAQTGNWLSFTAGLSDTNAKLQLKGIAKVVDAALRGSPRVVLSNRDVFDAYQANTTVQPGGVGSFANVSYGFGNEIVGDVGGFRSVRWGIDDLVTTDEFTTYDPAGELFVDGPQRTAQYEDTRTGIRGTIFKRWFVGKIIDAAMFNKGTSILT